MHKIFATILPLICGIAVSVAHADEPLHHKVSYADLNLNTTAGVKALYSRIEHAADRVCKPYAAPERDLSRTRDYRGCMKTAIDGAVAEVRVPQLSQYVAELSQRNRRPVTTTARR